MAKGSDSIKMTLKLEGDNIGPMTLNIEKTKTLTVAGTNLGLMSGTIGADGTADVIINRKTFSNRAFIYVENTGSTNAIRVGLSPDGGTTYYRLGTVNPGEFGMFPFDADTSSNLKAKLYTNSSTSTANWGVFEMS